MKWSTFKRSGPARQTTANRPAVRVWAAAGPFNCLADRRGSSREPIYRPMPRRPTRVATVVCALRLPAAEGRLKREVGPLRGGPRVGRGRSVQLPGGPARKQPGAYISAAAADHSEHMSY